MPLPTFVIVGAQKCGTSSLSATLRRHPEVFMSKPKELHYFDRGHDQGPEWYAAQFRPGPRQKAWGEATPVYLYEQESRERLTATVPDARLVVILRDPVKRAYSHYWHSRRMEFEELDSFEAALDAEPERLATDRTDRIRFSYVDRGRYLDQIRSLRSLHGEDKVHVMLLDDLKTDRVPTLAAMFRFLGVSEEPAGTIKEQWTNRYRVATEPGAAAEVVEYPPMADETRRRLAAEFAEENAELGAYLGRDLSAWG